MRQVETPSPSCGVRQARLEKLTCRSKGLEDTLNSRFEVWAFESSPPSFSGFSCSFLLTTEPNVVVCR
jgi:hypothetical protein